MLMMRRRFSALLIGGLAVGVAPRGLIRAARTQPISPPPDMRFDVFLDDSRIGRHAVTFTPHGDGFRAATEIGLKVELAFITLLDIQHQSEERWQAGRLVELHSRTRDGEETFEVTARPVASGLEVTSESGAVIAPPGIGSSNALWHIAMLDHSQVIDAQNGGIIGLVAEDQGSDQIELHGHHVTARLYEVITPNVTGRLWYADKTLVHAQMEVRGEIIEYRRAA